MEFAVYMKRADDSVKSAQSEIIAAGLGPSI